MSKLYNSYSANKAIRYAKRTSDSDAVSSRKLAGGSRITRSGDDAAGLSVSTKLKSTIKSNQMAARNTNDAFSILQVMEGTINEMGNMVTRIRELAMRSASDTISDIEREITQGEVTHILQEINRMSQGSEYLDHKLLKGDRKRLDIQVGRSNNEKNRITLDLKDFAQSPLALGIADIKVDSKHRARTSLIKIDYAVGVLAESRSKLGATSKRLESTLNNLNISVENSESAKSRITDTDYAQETANKARNSILAHGQATAIHQTQNSGRRYLRLLE